MSANSKYYKLYHVTQKVSQLWNTDNPLSTITGLTFSTARYNAPSIFSILKSFLSFDKRVPRPWAQTPETLKFLNSYSFHRINNSHEFSSGMTGLWRFFSRLCVSDVLQQPGIAKSRSQLNYWPCSTKKFIWTSVTWILFEGHLGQKHQHWWKTDSAPMSVFLVWKKKKGGRGCGVGRDDSCPISTTSVFLPSQWSHQIFCTLPSVAEPTM